MPPFTNFTAARETNEALHLGEIKRGYGVQAFLRQPANTRERDHGFKPA